MPAWIADLIPLAPWAAIVGLLIWVVVKVFPWLRKIMHFIDDVTGEPARAGMPPRPGLMERVGVIETKQDEQAVALAVVAHEVTTNHGSSLKDAVKEVSGAVVVLQESVTEVQSSIDAQGAWQKKHEQKSDAAFARIDKLEKEQE